MKNNAFFFICSSGGINNSYRLGSGLKRPSYAPVPDLGVIHQIPQVLPTMSAPPPLNVTSTTTGTVTTPSTTPSSSVTSSPPSESASFNYAVTVSDQTLLNIEVYGQLNVCRHVSLRGFFITFDSFLTFWPTSDPFSSSPIPFFSEIDLGFVDKFDFHLNCGNNLFQEWNHLNKCFLFRGTFKINYD